jgi:hypothetical protein
MTQHPIFAAAFDALKPKQDAPTITEFMGTHLAAQDTARRQDNQRREWHAPHELAQLLPALTVGQRVQNKFTGITGTVHQVCADGTIIWQEDNNGTHWSAAAYALVAV